MTGFNLAILAAVERIGATNVGVLVGASPVILALAASNRAVLAPAFIVVAGAAIVNGADANLNSTGLLIAFGALAAEVGFTLLAAPLLPRLGATRTAAWAAWIATVQLAVIHPRFPTPSTQEAAAVLYLALLSTALAFVLWFGAVQRLGADRAGLLVGLMPVAAVIADALLNGRAPSPADLAGTALVATGVAFGATRGRAPASGLRGGTRAASAASRAGTSSTCPAASSSPGAGRPAPASHR
jgi:drug/metabolite transporter (DMT)-like permease